MNKYTLVIHGGAGTVTRQELYAAKEVAVRRGLEEALSAGKWILEKGGSALDAVEVAVRNLEDNELFNAGRGSVLTHNGRHELDAAIMCGKTLKAGAVAAVTGIKNPIGVAREVMDKTDFVLLCGRGAEEFAAEMGVERMPMEYFRTQERFEEWQHKQAKEHHQQNTASVPGNSFGTVGAVALDTHGNLAAATSTGGLTGKKYGRAGDTPVIGGGTYANNQTCAVSCTGDGEYIIRAVSAYDVSCLVEYKGMRLPDACQLVIHQKLQAINGEGGLIAVDRAGNIAMPYNSPSMYRASAAPGQPDFIAIFEE